MAAIAGMLKRSWISLAAAKAVAAVCEAHVDQRDVGSLASDQLDELLTCARQSHHPVAERNQLAAEVLRHEPVVLGDGDAQGLHWCWRQGDRPMNVVRPSTITYCLKSSGGMFREPSRAPLPRKAPRSADGPSHHSDK